MGAEISISGGREAVDDVVDAWERAPFLSARQFAGVLLACLLPWVGGIAAVPKPIGDRPGNTSAKALESGEVPLSPADLQFYLTIMRASVSRYEHLSAQDLADIAEDKRLTAIEMADSQKMVQDMKAGNMQKAMSVDVFRATPSQRAIMRRGDDLLHGYIPRTLASNAGMGSDQWDKLQSTIDEVIDGPQGYGSGDEGSAPKLSAAALARATVRATKIIRARAANRKLVMPSAAEIKRLKSRLGELIVALESK